MVGWWGGAVVWYCRRVVMWQGGRVLGSYAAGVVRW